MSNKPDDSAACAGHAVVTGSSSGIGCAVAAHLLSLGWRVTGLDAAPASIAHAAFAPVSIDLSNPGELAALLPTLPVADALVHAAGVLRVGALGSLETEAGALMWKLHVEAATVLANGLLPGMADRRKGRVVLIGSRVSQGMPGRSQYAGTKAAGVALARSWAAEVMAQQVTVNVISPAATQTSMLADPARTGSAPRLPPMGRYIQPAEIAALTAFLLSPTAAAITGQDIAICGGSSLPR